MKLKKLGSVAFSSQWIRAVAFQVSTLTFVVPVSRGLWREEPLEEEMSEGGRKEGKRKEREGEKKGEQRSKRLREIKLETRNNDESEEGKEGKRKGRGNGGKGVSERTGLRGKTD